LKYANESVTLCNEGIVLQTDVQWFQFDCITWAAKVHYLTKNTDKLEEAINLLLPFMHRDEVKDHIQPFFQTLSIRYDLLKQQELKEMFNDIVTNPIYNKVE